MYVAFGWPLDNNVVIDIRMRKVGERREISSRVDCNRGSLEMDIKSWAKCTKRSETSELLPLQMFPRILVHLESMALRSREFYRIQIFPLQIELDQCPRLAEDIENLVQLVLFIANQPSESRSKNLREVEQKQMRLQRRRGEWKYLTLGGRHGGCRHSTLSPQAHKFYSAARLLLLVIRVNRCISRTWYVDELCQLEDRTVIADQAR
jgi:hypothetical protein